MTGRPTVVNSEGMTGLKQKVRWVAERSPIAVFAGLGALGLALGLASQAHAGVASTAHFVEPGYAALGLEPEVTLTDGAGMGLNARFTYGMNDLSNLTLIGGSGGGPRRFRLGANASFDLFPDMEGQPGVGIAAQTLFLRTPEGGRLDAQAMPYIHKSFSTPGGEVEPFLTVPFGLSFLTNTYRPVTSLVIGSLFKRGESIRYVTEVGININNSNTYVSGGIVYYP